MSPKITFLFLAFLFFYACKSATPNFNCDKADQLNWVATQLGCLHIKTYKSQHVSDKPNLVFVLHGDAPFNKPGYQYRLAQNIAQINSNTIAIGILRPGYTDPEGRISAGERGMTTGDNYTPEVIDAIAAVIQSLQQHYNANKITLVGHSGGAAITANLINRHPALVNAAVLVSCPCHLEKWRQHMMELQDDNPIWAEPVRSLSPMKNTNAIDPKTKILIITGDQDEVAPWELSKEYYEKLKAQKLNVRLETLKNEGHEIFLHELVMQSIFTILNDTNQ